MAARGWAALLLLAAVFAMHGLQCTAVGTEHTAGHGTAGIAVAPAGQLEGDLHAEASPPGPAAHSSVHDSDPGSVHAAAMAGAAPLAGLLTAGHDSTAPAGAAGHLWALCLAVFAAGLAVLLALLPRLLTLLPAATVWLRTHASTGLRPLRPPDLHALCLLRI